MLERASLPRRLAAACYELLLIGAVLFVAGFALAPFVSPGRSALDTIAIPTPMSRAVSFCALFAVISFYCIYFWSGGRRTLAMKTWRLVLLRCDGMPLDLRTSAIRYLAAWIGPGLALIAALPLRDMGSARYAVCLLPLNIAWALFDRDRQFLHDRLAGTMVATEAPPRPNGQSSRAR